MTISRLQKWLPRLFACLYIVLSCSDWSLAQRNPLPLADAFQRDAVPSVPIDARYSNSVQGSSSVQGPSSAQGSVGPQGSASDLQSVPLRRNPPLVGQLTIEGQGHNVDIFARDVDLRLVLAHLAEEAGVNIVVAESVQATVNTTLNNVPLWDALDAILKVNGLVWSRHGEIVFVTQPGSGQGNSGQSPGLTLQVFDLNFTSATEVLEVVNGLTSPAGKAFTHSIDIANTRQTRERIVVEDFPERLAAIATYIASVDNPPMQVMIEAHVLQVTLTNEQRHGVNLDGLLRLSGAHVGVRTQGFANGDASPGFMLGLEATDLDGMIEALCSNSNVRTLAAPKILVVNGQEARVQIGSRFGYFVTTTTQTSSLQSVEFLDIGVVLDVRPTITRDGQVLLHVAPKVSGGRINPDSGLPEEDTTEASTTVLLPDGKGMIIGGLIKESDVASKSWVPWLGKIPVLGHLFRRSNNSSQRTEVILTLTPRIVPFTPAGDCVPSNFIEGYPDGPGIITSAQPTNMNFATP